MTTNLAVLNNWNSQLANCQQCKLHQGRTKVVFGEGNPEADIVFVGEGPGENEDKTGRPFVGRAGQLLDKMIQAMGLERKDVYITNVVKCRPPNNRVPEPDEVSACSSNMMRELGLIKPKVIIPLGMSAAKAILELDKKATMGNIHGKEFFISHYKTDLRVIPTYHPAAMLRNSELKKPTWDDLQKVMKIVEEKK